eukprot:TRINITY_DN6792_c0_g2_i1.p1 TRINITY_DN6792_c0_g2~~TRINITY_DN6792_c0_g2_i1.p1  ORF type:complete len:182 (-),score=26.08 TRINITY_DN6792_c0_g2_i1:228-773(-)
MILDDEESLLEVTRDYVSHFGSRAQRLVKRFTSLGCYSQAQTMASVGCFVRWALLSESAADYKARVETHIASLGEKSGKLVGRDYQMARSAIGKSIAKMRNEPRYVDACRVVKGQAPAHGFFTREACAHIRACRRCRGCSPWQRMTRHHEQTAGLCPSEVRELEPLLVKDLKHDPMQHLRA